MPSLGVRLRELRVASGLTQEELAERSGLSVRAISDIERGRSTRPYRSSLEQLAIALQLPDHTAAEFVALARSAAPSAAVTDEPGPGADDDRPTAVPAHQLPPATGRLHGRERDLTALDHWLANADFPRIVTMVGPGGVGKTALAVHWAYQVRDRFPGGELYLNLHGFEGAATPMSTATALDVLLRALGVPPGSIPPDEQARAALYRSITEERHVLVLLDNARDTVQVRALLAGPDCLTIITSRNQLRGLVVREGAHRVTVGPLGPGAAAAVFEDSTAQTIDSASPDFRELVERCSGLPLALRIVAERIARDETTLPELIQHVRERSTRLDVMNADDDDQSNVRAILSWSYNALPPDAATAFELLGAFPGTDITAEAAAALFDTTTAQARRLLDTLITLHLVERSRPGGYQLHDVLRAYAAELSESTDAADAAVVRVLDWYRHSAAAARDQLLPLADADREALLGEDPRVPQFDRVRALEWFDEELQSLLRAVSCAAERGLDELASDIAWLLWYYFDFRKMLNPWVVTHTIGLEAARRTGSPTRIVRILNGLGMVEGENGRLAEALSYFREELAITQELQDEYLESTALNNLAITYQRLGDIDQALEFGRRSVELAQRTGTVNLLIALANLSETLSKVGRHQEAMDQLRLGQELAPAANDARADGQISYAYGVALAGLGRHDEALEHLQIALQIQRELGWRNGEGFTLMNIGDSLAAQGATEDAFATWRQALQIFADLRTPEAADEVRAHMARFPEPPSVDESNATG